MANYFVSNSGDDSNPGTFEQPFRTIAEGIKRLKAGDSLNLRGGSYVGSVVVKGLRGTQSQPIVIRSHDGEHATIDGCVTQFRDTGRRDWFRPLRNLGAHPDEFVSRDRFPLENSKDFVNRGAFLDVEPYTRLITYSRLEDLRADNERFDAIPPLQDLPHGPLATDENGKSLGSRRPWVYMGPGIFFDKDTRRVHIRLSHTHNQDPGIEDYRGETDPRALRLAISHEAMTTLTVDDSQFVRFENLSIRFGGEQTVRLRRTVGVTFERVRIAAATNGVVLAPILIKKKRIGNDLVLFHDCEFRGGLPPWCFRSDLKGEYFFKIGRTVFHNQLGKNTSSVLLSGIAEDRGIEVHNCEFRDGHDLYLFGKGMIFHHNWIDNLNDEALVFDHVEADNVHVFQNVFTRCLDAISFGGSKISGRTHVYRNLIDLRRPTAGHRPRHARDENVFRFGQLYKDNMVDGPLDLFHNTCLLSGLGKKQQASYHHYLNTDGDHPRRSFNNIFVALSPNAGSDHPITYLPPPSFPGPTDGNLYFRIGHKEKPLFVHGEYKFPPPDGPKFEGGFFPDIPALKSSQFFTQSQTQYAPGYENDSIEGDPLFRRMSEGIPQTDGDDLRLRDGSPARGGGIVLPDELRAIDPLAPSDPKAHPDIGCYVFGHLGLRVGVGGRRRFPPGPDD